MKLNGSVKTEYVPQLWKWENHP